MVAKNPNKLEWLEINTSVKVSKSSLSATWASTAKQSG